MIYERKKTYPESRLDENNMTATMFLDKGIAGSNVDPFDGSPAVNGYDFAAELFQLSQMGYKVTVDINSPGGGVVPGLSIFDAVVRTKSNTRVVGLAASMAAAISQAGAVRKMNDIGSIMIHGITPNGTEDQYMDILNAQLRGILETRSKLSRERIDKIFDSGEDHFFGVAGVPEDRHAEKMGLVDEVIATGLSIPKERLELANNGKKLVLAYNQVLSPKAEEEKPKSKKMENKFTQVKAELGLDAEASEAAVLKAIQKLGKTAAGADALQAANNKLTAENTSLQETRVNDLLNSAKESGYPEDQLDGLKSFAVANYDGAKNLVAGLKGAGSLSTSTGTVETAQNVSGPVAATASQKTSTPETLMTYKDYMSSPENEAKFFALSDEKQAEVFSAHAKAYNIKNK